MFRPLAIFLAIIPMATAQPAPPAKDPLTYTVDDSPAVTTITGRLTAGRSIILRIDWLNQNPAPRDFVRTLEHGIAGSTHQLGTTRITRTILASAEDQAIFIHFLADKPGDLSFRATLVPPAGTGEPRIEDRREIAWIGPEPTPAAARAWIIPFESDVESEGSAILLRGEGECLLVLNFAETDSPPGSVAATWNRIAAAHDPGANPPDPSKVWQSVFGKATRR